MRKPKVSVIIPIYGVEKYIERCAKSLFEQTLNDIEYIFVNDCTPDSSIEILNRIIEDYSQQLAEEGKTIKIVCMPTNSGLPAVRKHGVQLATGEYITHCDSDDWIDVTMYQKLYEKAISEESDIVVTGYKETDGITTMRQSIHHFNSKDEYISNMLYMKESWAIWDKLCKKELYDDIEFPKFSMGEDLVTTIQLVLKAKKISNVEEYLYNYFYNANSITKVKSEESRYNNWKQSIYNTTKAISYFSLYKKENEFKQEFEYLKYKQKKLAGDLAFNKKYAREWINTFNSINTTVYHLKNISLIEKIKFYLLMAYSQSKALQQNNKNH